MSDKKTIHSKAVSGNRDDGPLRRQYPEVMEGETSLSTPDHQDMKPPNKKPRLLPPYIVTPSRPSPTTRLASYVSMEQEIEKHRTWQNNAVENLCLFIVENYDHVIRGYYQRRYPSDRSYEECTRDKESLISAARTAETDHVFGHIRCLVLEIFLNPLRLRMKHLVMETNELKHITKNLWNHPMLDGYASWADALVKETLDAGVRQELAGLQQDYEELMQSILFKTKENCGEDIRINGLIRFIGRSIASESIGHLAFNDEVKEKVLRCIQQLYCTARQKEQMRRGWEGPCPYAKWDPTYFYL